MPGRAGRSRAGRGKFERHLGEIGDEYRALCSARMKHLVDVRQPLVLVSQVQRSGGTLLSQLFDGHPECHAHPGELRIGYPKKHDWPPIDLAASPEEWFEMLFERAVFEYLKSGGYAKPAYRGDLPVEFDVLPWLFAPRLQREIFRRCVAEREIAAERDVLDCYMTSFFNAWLDNQNLYTEPKRVVTGFAAGLALDLDNVERFFAAYPTGTLIAMVRDPRSWFASASTYRDVFRDLDTALPAWESSVETSLAAKERRPERVRLLSFEQLVVETEHTMRKIADWIGISFSTTLLEPTFNSMPIRADSSFPVEGHGVLSSRAASHDGRLDEDVARTIEERTRPLYGRALEQLD